MVKVLAAKAEQPGFLVDMFDDRPQPVDVHLV